MQWKTVNLTLISNSVLVFPNRNNLCKHSTFPAAFCFGLLLPMVSLGEVDICKFECIYYGNVYPKVYTDVCKDAFDIGLWFFLRSLKKPLYLENDTVS